MAYLGDSLYVPSRGRGRKFGSGFRQRAILLRNQAKEWEVYYLSGFTAERSVLARLISTLWIQTVLVCEPPYGASRGGAGEGRGCRFFPGFILYVKPGTNTPLVSQQTM